MLRTFIRWNQNVCDRIAHRFPHASLEIFEHYVQTVGQFMNARRGQTVIDIGSGKHCPFASIRNPVMETRIIGVDVSDDEMRANHDVDEIRIADVSTGLPFEDQSADLIVSRSALEHIVKLEPFVQDSHRVLKNGGMFIHHLPSRNAPYALINRVLPHAVSQWLLHFVWVESREWGGFRTYYDCCSYRMLPRVLQRNGFEIIRFEVNYYQSQYYRFFVPLYLLSMSYELVIRALHLKNLSADLLVVARKIPS